MQILDALRVVVELALVVRELRLPVRPVLPLRRRVVEPRDVRVRRRMHSREEPVQHSFLKADVVVVAAGAAQAVLLVDRRPDVGAVIPGVRLLIELQIHVIRRVRGDVAAHVEPKRRKRLVAAVLVGLGRG